MKEQTQNNYVPSLKDVSKTLLIPLYFKAKETLEDGIIVDYTAVNIVNRLAYDFTSMEKDWRTQISIAVRTEILDDIVTDYINKTPKPVIVNLGAGLDTRHVRFQNVKWYQLDLEEAMKLRHVFFRGEPYTIAKSVLDFSWINDIEEKENVLFIVEGVLMYLDENQIKSVFRQIGRNFKKSLIAFNTMPKSIVKTKKHKSVDIKSAPFKWGNNNISEIEQWNYGLKRKKPIHTCQGIRIVGTHGGY